MFEGWANFYLMIGSAAGALIGLLFVVATLTGNLGREQAQRGSTVYLTPTVFHFAVVLVASAITAVPQLDIRTAAGLLAAAGLWGLIYAANIARMVARRDTLGEPHWTDFWCYGVGPAVLYAAELAAAGALGMGVSWAPQALAAALLALLLLTIRNAWDLVTYLAPAAAGKR
ncbi:MAG TPA: hypothetical protein VNW53_08330 [Phenylobacterium sp.]|jgi:hypothetical protein|uniref:hypothetical protein n=1 Tax=Phenylobacterium sp. TaxID=1871053 RepID=UPI002C435801|nr:hypothetical protein [Phenylobacterium sp.]HXA38990.1 hypothetical protein [Phenylobacterium sp.]